MPYKSPHLFSFFSSSCCLAGRAYPLGDIPEDLVPLVKNQVGAIFTALLPSMPLANCAKDNCIECYTWGRSNLLAVIGGSLLTITETSNYSYRSDNIAVLSSKFNLPVFYPNGNQCFSKILCKVRK